MWNEFWALPVWVPVSLALGLVSLAASIYFNWWFARGPGLSVQASGTTLISAPANDRVTVRYDGAPVRHVTQSIIWLWRTGRGTIEGSKIVDDDPMVLAVPDGCQILDVAVLRESTRTNGFTHDFAPSDSPVKAVQLGFKYLDRRQGVAIEVYHTVPDPEAVEITGTIIGVPRGIRRTSSGSTMRVPTGLIGSIAVKLPTAVIPWHLRGAGRQPRSLRSILIDALADVVALVVR